MDVPVKEDSEDSKFGAGEVHTRLIAAFGRIAPSGVNSGGAGPVSPFNGYSRIAGDASASNEGLLNSSTGNVSGGSNNRSSLYVEDLHYHQHIKSGVPLLTDWFIGNGGSDEKWAATGDLYFGSMPWRYLYDKSPYRGNELSQFQNTAFVNTPGVAVNQSMPMIAYQWHQKLGSDDLTADVTTGVGSSTVGDVLDGLNVTYEGRLNYKLFDRPGNVYAGGYNIWDAGNTISSANLGTVANRSGGGSTTGSTGSTNALYTGWSQDWYKGLGTTFNYLLSSGGNWNYIYNSLNQNLGASTATVLNGSNTFNKVAVAARQSLSGVLNVPMSLFGVRDNDNLGVGYSLIQLREDGIGRNFPRTTRYNQAWENTVEAYYKWSVNDAISIVPSVQFITNNLGVRQNGLTTVIGLRTSYAF
jgi:hypothetical protein